MESPSEFTAMKQEEQIKKSLLGNKKRIYQKDEINDLIVK